MTDAEIFARQQTSPRIFHEAVKMLGTKEVRGGGNNPVIVGWADEIGGWVADFYSNDEIPWCGLFVGICAKRAGFEFGQRVLSARAWVHWGNPVNVTNDEHPMLGDVLIFTRRGGGHVGLYAGEDSAAYYVLGGNQGDCVSIVRIAKNRLLAARRCKWKIKQPAEVRRVHFTDRDHGLSENEA